MIEKPDIEDQTILNELRMGYAIAASGIEFLPLGNDATAWVFRVDPPPEMTAVYFLKLKKGNVDGPGLFVPRCLKDQGMDQVVAPLPALDGRLWRPIGKYSLVLYPFIQGRPGMEIGLNPDQWTAYGAFLKRLHATRLPAHLLNRVPRETFVPYWGKMVRRLMEHVAGANSSMIRSRPAEPVRLDRTGEMAANFLREKAYKIRKLLERTEDLGRSLRETPPDFVLCHTDIHTANLLLDDQGRIFVVDWDNPLLAPKERDLMFIAAADPEAPLSREENLFYRGYGETAINRTALAYYRYEWVIQEIGDYGERVFFTREMGEKTRQEAVRGLMNLFQPGDVVDQALLSDRG